MRSISLRPRSPGRVIAVLFAVWLANAPQLPIAAAATLTWNGRGLEHSNWFYRDCIHLNICTSNWAFDRPPVNGDSLVFAGTPPAMPFNDRSDLSVSALTFDAGAAAFTLNGLSLEVTGVITNASASPQTINMPITVGASGNAWSGGTAGINFNGALNLGDHSLTLGSKIAVNNGGQDFIVGGSGTAALTMSSASTLGAATGYVGRDAGAVGTVSVDGAGSQWINSANLHVGYIGAGTLGVVNGGKVSDVIGYIATAPGAGGSVTVDGAGSLWANALSLQIGEYGNGTLVVRNGGRVESITGNIAGQYTGSGSVSVTDPGSNWTNAGFLYVGRQGVGVLRVAGGGKVSSFGGVIGYADIGTGRVTVDGVGSLWSNANELLTGYYGSGVLEILNGGRVENSVGTIADQAGSKGMVTVDGVGSLWSTPGGLSVGNAGAGTLNLQNSGVVSAGATHLGSRGVVNLDGGALHVGETSAVAGALFNWISGTLHLAGAGGGSLADGLLGALGGVLSLRPGMSLRVDHTLTVAAGNVLVLNGGQLASGALALDGGTIVAGAGGANFRDTGNLTGHGTVAGSVIGGSGRTIIASGGTLTMGNAGLLDGFNFDGHLYTGSNQVILLSAGRARLGETTTLDGGARLVTINGAELRFGQRLLFNGDASIAGALNSNGRVIGTGGVLSFLGDVSGAGDFTGNFFFHAGHSPGNSPAIVNFNGGNVTYGDAASLTLELFGPRAGAQYDQLLGINALTFNGRLRLLFGNGFVPDAGSHFALLGFNTFSGSLAPERISVAGFDASRLDYSRLGIDGTLSVTAVPEPGAQVMLLAGLVMMGLIVRRRRGHSR